MKKTAVVLLAILVLAAFFAAAVHADDNSTEPTEKDMDMAEAMNTPQGAEVRLLQLEKQVARNIEYGSTVINEIENKSLNVPTDDLKAILSQMNNLRTDIEAEVEAAKALPANESVDRFLSLKERAVNLTGRFREEVHSGISPQVREIIKEAADQKGFPKLKEYESRIRAKASELNAIRLKAMLDIMNKTDSNLLQRVKDGNITIPELRQAITSRFRGLMPSEKKDFLAQVKGEREQLLRLRNRVAELNLNLSPDVAMHMREIMGSENLTYPEKKAKMGVYIREQIRERINAVPKVPNRTGDAPMMPDRRGQGEPKRGEDQ